MKYRREIDGLRALAVMPVILFHAGFTFFSGGFVGVDVFFVISGYLITAIIISELVDERFSIAEFYERRARRILPALFVVIVASLPFAYMWMTPVQIKDFSSSLIAVSLFASNILFWNEDGYFAAATDLKPLLHTWSLAVEEQYYLIFPLFLMLLRRVDRRVVLFGIVALAFFSLSLSEWGWRHKPSANFYLAPTRAWELLIGSICAFLSFGREQRSNDSLSIAGLLLIVFSIFAYDESTPFPSLYALAPTVGAALILLFAGEGTWVARLLSLRAVVGAGLVSYSAYLWHQPLFAFARLRSLTEPSQILMGALVVASLLLAWVTWLYVEQPFRKGVQSPLSTRRSVFFASGAVTILVISIGLAGHYGDGFKFRSNGLVSFAELEARIVPNRGLHPDCEGGFNESANCSSGSDARVLLWGDSFAMHLAQGLKESANGKGFVQQTTSQCVPILGMAQVRGWVDNRSAEHCIEFNAHVLRFIQSRKFETVIISSPFSGLFEGDVKLQSGETLGALSIDMMEEALAKTVRAVRDTGAHVLVVSPTPQSGWDTGQCLVRSVFFSTNENACDFRLDSNTKPLQMLQRLESTVPVYWLSNDLCSEGLCDAMKDGLFMYRDGGHLSIEGSTYLGQKYSWMTRFEQMAN